MRLNVLECLACSSCGGRLDLIEVSRRSLGTVEEIGEGTLVCAACSCTFPIRGGIADMLHSPTQEAIDEIEGNREMVRTDRAACDDEWLLALPRSHTVQRPEMAVHDEEADLNALLSLAGPLPCRVLDLGAGTCWTSQRWARAGHRTVAADISLEKYIGLESAATFIAHTGDFFERVRFDMNRRWPLGEGVFDIVAAMSTIHHASDLRFAFGEARRVLRPGGLLLLVETTRSLLVPEGRAAFGERERTVFHRHERIYSQREYRRFARWALLELSFRAAPSFAAKLEMVASGRRLIGRDRLKHRLAARLALGLRPAAVQHAIAGRAFPLLNAVFGSQFVGIARRSA